MNLPAAIWSQLRRRLLIIYDRMVKPSQGGVGSVASPHYTLWFVRKGTAFLQPKVKPELQVETGQAILIPPLFAREQWFAPATHMLSVHFAATWPNSRHLFTMSAPIIAQAASWSRLETAATNLLEASPFAGEPMTMPLFFKREHLFETFLVEWYQIMLNCGASVSQPVVIDERVCKAMKVLDQTRYGGTVPYGALNEIANLSRIHLDRLFRSQLSKSPREYLEEQIAERIRQTLVETGISIKELCFASGFSNQSHFVQWFKGRTGYTPARYRQAHRSP